MAPVGCSMGFLTLCACGGLQSDEEIKAAADAARAAREAADKKAKNEAAMKEFADTMAKVPYCSTV